jgi:uncharacterized protein
MSDQSTSRVPEVVDAWRMVATKREFEGRVPLANMSRLRGSLVDDAGEVNFMLSFGTDSLKLPFVELRVNAQLPLECQRSLQRFLLPVELQQRLGLIRDEADEAALPPDYEAFLVPEDGMLKLLNLVEDELILALPVVPVSPDVDAVERDFMPTAEETASASPFAALVGWKKE